MRLLLLLLLLGVPLQLRSICGTGRGGCLICNVSLARPGLLLSCFTRLRALPCRWLLLRRYCSLRCGAGSCIRPACCLSIMHQAHCRRGFCGCYISLMR
jgi:hypothetical protein